MWKHIVPTGLTDLDRLTGGLRQGELIVVAASKGSGKTAFALTIAQNAAIAASKTIAVFSPELNKEALITRMLCSESHVDSDRLQSGYLSYDEWTRLAAGLQKLSEATIFIDDTNDIDIPEIKRKLGIIKAEKSLDLLIIDHIQLVESTLRISRDLKEIAREFHIPVVVSSHLSSSVHKRYDKRPFLSDLPDRGIWEEDADLVIFIYRGEMYYPTEENAGIAEIIISKNRYGSTDIVRLAFIKPFTRFENLWRPE